MTLIPDIGRAWRFFSVQAMAWATAIQVTWMSIPEGMRDKIPEPLVHWATVALLVLGILGRVVKQEPKEADDGSAPNQ